MTLAVVGIILSKLVSKINLLLATRWRAILLARSQILILVATSHLRVSVVGTVERVTVLHLVWWVPIWYHGVAAALATHLHLLACRTSVVLVRYPLPVLELVLLELRVR
jgi:hypothetical protein